MILSSTNASTRHSGTDPARTTATWIHMGADVSCCPIRSRYRVIVVLIYKNLHGTAKATALEQRGDVFCPATQLLEGFGVIT